MTKRKQIQFIIERILAEYGFDSSAGKDVASKIAGEIYNLIPARIVSTTGIKREPVPEEIEIFRSITGFYPAKPAWPEIITRIQGQNRTELEMAYKAWCFRTNQPRSATWLKWINGVNQNRVIVS